MPNFSTVPRPKHKRLPANYAAYLVAVVAFIANTSAVAGVITSHANEIMITASVLTFVSGAYLLLRRWGKPVDWIVLLAILVIIAGTAMCTLALQPGGLRSGTTTNVSNATGANPNEDKDDGLPLSPNSNHDVVFEKKFKLTTAESLELDNGKGTMS